MTVVRVIAFDNAMLVSRATDIVVAGHNQLIGYSNRHELERENRKDSP